MSIDEMMNEKNIEVFDDDSNEYQDVTEHNDKLKRNLDIKKYDRMIKYICFY